MPRTQGAPLGVVTTPLNDDAVAQSLAAADQLGERLALVEAQFGDGEPFDFERSALRCEALVAHIGEQLLLLGRELIRVKEHLPHGDFEAFIERRLQIDPRTAQRSMQAAMKFIAGTPRAQLGQRLNRSKLLELMVEDDAALDALADGGTVAGVKLDEVERMTVRELRAALRAERDGRREDRDTSEQLLASKDQQINQLDRELARRRTRTAAWAELTRERISEMSIAFELAAENLTRLAELREAVTTDDYGAGGEIAFNLLAKVYVHLVQEVDKLSEGIRQDCDAMFTGVESLNLIDALQYLAEKAPIEKGGAA